MKNVTTEILGMVRVRFRVRVTLRLTISQSVCLGIEPNLGQLTRVCILLEILGMNKLQVVITDVAFSIATGMCPHISSFSAHYLPTADT
jgi:hypothetical protein